MQTPLHTAQWKMQKGPLSGLLVIDISRVLSGPFCTLLLADLGARVIKVEPPEGDATRTMQPVVDGRSAYFEQVNRGKESIALDLKQPADRALFQAMLDRADVLVDNFRPGVMARLGFEEAAIAARWPRLVHASISGFGQTGPDARRPAYDLVIQAMGGLMALTGPEGGDPVRVGASVADISAGLFSAIGILAALLARGGIRAGQGDRIDISMLDCQVAMLEHALALAQVGRPPRRTGARYPTAAPGDAFHTADGFLVIAATTQHLFAAAMAAIGRPELSADARFATREGRAANHLALKQEIEATLASGPTEYWDALLTRAGVPCGKVRDMRDLLRDPQLQARNMLRPSGAFRLAGNPVKLAAWPEAERPPPAPALDEARARLLAEFARAES